MTEHEQDYFEGFEQALRTAIRRGQRAPAPDAPRRRQALRKLLAITLRSTPRRAGLALALTSALGAALALLFLSLGTGTQEAFAGWTPTPRTPTNTERAAATARCRSALGRMREFARKSPSLPAEAGANGEAQRLKQFERSRGSFAPSPADFKLLAVDIRGPYTLALLADGHDQATCFTGPRTPGSSGRTLGASVGYSFVGTPEPAAREISGFAGGITSIGRVGGEHAHTFAVGRAGTRVEAVTLVLASHRRILATTEKGWYLAWWPGTLKDRADRVTAAEIKTASGTRRVAFP